MGIGIGPVRGIAAIVLHLTLAPPAAAATPVEDEVAHEMPPAESPDDSAESDGRDDWLPRLSWAATYASWYSFQGLDYSDGRHVIQPEVGVQMASLSLGLWGNVDPSRRELNELDATLRFERTHGRLTGAVGYAHLSYPHREGWEPSQEILGELSIDAPLHPSLGVHWDVEDGRGVYASLGIDQDLPLDRIPLALGLRLHAQRGYYDMSGLVAVEARAALGVSWSGLRIQPGVSRLWTRENGDFRGDEAVPSAWLFSFALSPP